MTDHAASIVITPTPIGISVSGEIDAHSAPSLAEALAGAPGDPLVVDLAGVDFVDSSGLRVFIEAHQTRAESGRSLVLANPSSVVRRLFDIAGVESYLAVVDDGNG